MLRYVCKFCGSIISEFPNVAQVPGQGPNVTSFCDKPECRKQASDEFNLKAWEGVQELRANTQ